MLYVCSVNKAVNSED